MIQLTPKQPRSLLPILDNYNFGFVIIYPESNTSGLRRTMESIRKTYPKATIVCSAEDEIAAKESTELAKICPTVNGGVTITGLMNTGIRESGSPWNVIVFAGSWVGGSLYRKFDLFVKEETDILFPVVEGRMNFVEGSMNGIIIHKRALLEAGEFPTFPMRRFTSIAGSTRWR